MELEHKVNTVNQNCKLIINLKKFLGQTEYWKQVTEIVYCTNVPELLRCAEKLRDVKGTEWLE